MTDLTLEDLQTALSPLHSVLTTVASRVDGLASEVANVRTRVDGFASEMANVPTRVDGLVPEMANVRTRVDGLASEMTNVRIRVDGLPLLGVAIDTLRQDVRMTRAAINDIARINITAGEVEAMHTDINRTMSRQDAIETRLATLERLAEEQQNKS